MAVDVARQERLAQLAADGRLLKQYRRVRGFSEHLVEPLEPEDCVVQSMPDVSPTRWHLAHTTWFFETFILLAADSAYLPYAAGYDVLFNSYYNTVGEQFPRPRRGLLSRPTLGEVLSYRQHVDERMAELLAGGALSAELLPAIETGLHHEQQHQELLLTDIKHVFSCNPLYPVYREVERDSALPEQVAPLQWIEYDEDVELIGHEGVGFAFDNEFPRHRVLVPAGRLADRPVTCGEYLEFIEDGGYRRPELWLSLGWQHVGEHGWQAPLYWTRRDGAWHQFTLSGLRPVVPSEPVCHVSYFEADAFARWSGASLPNEAAWERAAAAQAVAGNFADTAGHLHPQPTTSATTAGADAPTQMFGDVWEWTASPYMAYPGYRPPQGALGEYNGKFMCNQYVLRGGSCATSQDHVRATYRNFFPPDARWQFTGIRLAQSR